MSNGKWRDMGLDAAHEDIAQKGDSCATIEEARVRIGAWLRDSDATADDVEACAQGYLAGWAAALPAAKPVAPPWGPLPSAAEVEAHVARCAPARRNSGAPWARKHGDSSGEGVSIVYLAVIGDRVQFRAPTGGVWYAMTDRDRAAQWRPVDADGVAVERAR